MVFGARAEFFTVAVNNNMHSREFEMSVSVVKLADMTCPKISSRDGPLSFSVWIDTYFNVYVKLDSNCTDGSSESVPGEFPKGHLFRCLDYPDIDKIALPIRGYPLRDGCFIGNIEDRSPANFQFLRAMIKNVFQS